MTLKRCTQPVYRVERSGRDMIEGSPVIGNEVLRLQHLEQGKSVGAGEMPLSKSRFPPGGVTDGQQSDVEVSSVSGEMILNQPGGVVSERRITGKEAGRLIGIY